MLDLAISGISIVVLLGIVYWCQRTFVSEKTCIARQDCIEGAIISLEKLMNTKFKHITGLIEKLIEKH